ncbi:hypothetical protein B0A52_00061 [Exophiala mesophila]|uniref:HECT-type E3 ubiquitin transferase n=1 Tax=Exophiala mesophila TaxID=212818 RepID=A0A438NIZ9_EXOME|nr:hypothetical protein B0A52_00061 [Exophiala mesophila]
MGKVTRKPQEKHKVSLSPAVSDLVKKVTTVGLADLPALINGWSQRWPYPRGDLNNWIEPLDRFDSILQSFITKYGLDQGPQVIPFGTSLLLEGSPGVTEERLKELKFGPEGDRELIEVILVFSKLLVEKCANRAVYNSTDRLNDLLNTTSLSLLRCTLRITFYLAQRYAERPPHPQQMSTKFYDFDHGRLQKLAAPFDQPQTPALKRTPTSPLKQKSKDKPTHAGKARRNSTTTSPNDFRALCRDPPVQGDRHKSSAAPDRDWQQWAHVKVSWKQAVIGDHPASASQTHASDMPSTPTPNRHPVLSSSRFESTDSPSDPSHTQDLPKSAASDLRTIEYSFVDLTGHKIEDLLAEAPDDIPADVKYDLLHQLRVAYGLVTSSKTRKELLAVRLLAIASLANVFTESELAQKVFQVEGTSFKPHELIQQLVGLTHDPKKGQGSVPLYLQTIAMETMGVLAPHKLFASDINAALGPGSTSGLLAQLTQKGLADIAKGEGSSTDNVVGDDWRDAIFSLPRTLIEATGHHGRSSEPVIAASFVSTYLTGFNITTAKAMRVHLRMLDFVKTFFHHFKDGMATLMASNAFEAISTLLGKLVSDASQMYKDGEGIPAQFRTRATDYEIPYMHQQIIRSVIDMINDISGHQDPQADRVLRSLVDSQALLQAFRLIADSLPAFGAHTWSEVVKAVCGFLHNEPTSYTVISEAGIVQSLLNTVNGSQAATASSSLSPDADAVSSVPRYQAPGIPPSVDAIINISQVFGAICLTNAGFEAFKSSGVLDAFFTIFESPPHVKVLKDTNTLALLGSTFDELVRHHPNLRTSILSAVIVMIARVRHICRSLAVTHGAGPKLWLPAKEDVFDPCGGRQSLSLEILPPVNPGVAGSQNSHSLKLPNGRTLILVEETLPPTDAAVVPADSDGHGLSANDYARPAIAFLVTFFENQTLCTNFLDYDAADLVLDFITLPSLPVGEQAFARQDGLFQELASAVHMMAETKPGIVLPALVDRARFACSELKHFSRNQPNDWTCYFAPLIKPGNSNAGEGNNTSSYIEKHGTRVVKSLMATFCLSQVLAEVFNAPMYSTRSAQTYLFGNVNLADILAEVSILLGGISAACYREEIALQRSIPQNWLAATKPEHFSTGDDEVDKVLSVRPKSTSAGINTSSDLLDMTDPEQLDTESLEEAKRTPFFRNVQVLRYLLIVTPAANTEFLCRLGRGIVCRRRPDTFAKQKIALVASALSIAYLTQLQPSFLGPERSQDRTSEDLDARFTYFVVALDNVRRSFYDDSNSSAGPLPAARQSFVVEVFRKGGGIKALTKIGTEFFDKLKSCKVEQSIFCANAGLKICLDILDEFTNSKTIMESLQSHTLKNPEPQKAYFFVPSQVLLSLRVEALPLTRLIWESDYADQASKDVVQKLVSILKHVLTGDAEAEAIQSSARQPVITPGPARKPTIEPSKVSTLQDKGYDEALAREAIYRTNTQTSGSNTAAEEYCRAITANARRRRLPIPDGEIDASQSAYQTPTAMSPPVNFPSDPLAAALFGSPSRPTEAAFASRMNNDLEDDDMGDGMSDNQGTVTVSRRSENPSEPASSAMDIHNILNDESARSQPVSAENDRRESSVMYSVETISTERVSIREELADHCNNVLNTHQNLTFELSDLILSATKKLSEDDAKEYWRTTSDLLVTSLLSMQVDDDISDGRGKKIAAAAHLVALLIQDSDVFKDTLGVYQDSFEGLLTFLQIPAGSERSAEDSFQWVAPVLLIMEKMLSKDSEPADVKWEPPSDLETSKKALVIPVSILTHEQKSDLFDALMGLLRRVEIATRLGEKRNLQSLFHMIKQLANGVGHRLQSSFMTVLRHIIEDEETLRQIMRSEIRGVFNGRNSTRQMDTTAYIRELHHLVLRSPEIFVQTTSELVKFSSWAPHSSSGLALQEPQSEPSQDTTTQANLSNADVAMEPAASVESPDDHTDGGHKSKGLDLKAPVVEHPDGVIHFILSELMNYKDVEDAQVVTESSTTKASPKASDGTHSGSTGESQEDSTPQPSTPSKHDASKFRPEDHPIFSYRCFLMYTLTELLHSYNRAKIELINFSRKADSTASTPSKPRSTVLNYFLNGLIPSCYIDKDDSVHWRKKFLTSDWAIRVLVALCAKTGEKNSFTPGSRHASTNTVDDQDDEPDLTFVRRFVLEHAIKSYKDAIASTEGLQMKYSRLLCLAALFNRLLTKPAVPDGSPGSNNTSFKVLGRMMFEKNLTAVLTNSLAEIDLSYSGSKRVIKFILRPLQELTTLATQLSLTSPELLHQMTDNMSEDIISSASSVSDVDEEREETPDLFRNSALGMMDPNHNHESDSESDENDEDEEMYDEEYDEEMEYENGMVAGGNDGEAVSDEEVDDEMTTDAPIEGLPGDVPMELELLVDDPHMEVDSDDEEDEDDGESDSEDDDDDEDEGEDFMIEEDGSGELNADDENDSLNDGREGDEAEWEDEDEENEDDESEDDDGPGAFDDDEMPLDGAQLRETPGVFSSLLRVLDNHDLDGPVGLSANIPPELIIPTGDPGDAGEDDEDDEDEDEDEEGDEMDENEFMEFDFDHFLAGRGDDAFDPGDGLVWNDMPPFTRRHRPMRGPGGHGPNFMGRRLGHGQDMHHIPRSGRPSQHGRAVGDDGTNPLLRRPQPEPSRQQRIESLGHNAFYPQGMENFPGLAGFPPLGTSFQTVVRNSDGTEPHGSVLDAIMQAIHRGDPGTGGRMQFSMTAPLGEIRDILRPSMSAVGHRHHARDDYPRASSFVPATTMTRWQEEARILFGNTYVDKIQRVQILITSLLVPPAQLEEKEKLRKREEKLRLEQETQEKLRLEAERKKKEAEEQEAAAKADEERARAEAEAERLARGEDDGTLSHTNADTEPMEDVQGADGDISVDVSENATSAADTRPRVFTTIRGRQLDITGLSIDHDYLEALPEELREEVIMQQYATRREEAQQEGNTDPNGGIDQDFLNALPEEIREELRQQEAHAQRRREREAARRQASAAAGQAQPEEMDNDNFFATLEPDIRRAILAEQPPEILRQLNPRHAAEGRAHARRLMHYTAVGNGDSRDDRANDGPQRDKKQIIQMVDKAGVATLLRLMFLPQQGSLRTNLWAVLRNICGNRQTRFEVIHLLLIVLKEGSTDVSAVERSLANLSLRAKATVGQKTPQPLRRTLSMPAHGGLSDEVTPLVVVQQCLSALKQLSSSGMHIRTIFLREVDVNMVSKKGKAKAAEAKTARYPLNDLVGLLDRKLIVESSTCLQSLAELLAAVTSPLATLLKKDKEKVSTESKAIEDSSGDATASTDLPQPATNDTQNAANALSETVSLHGVDEAGAGTEPTSDSTKIDNVDESEDIKSKKTFEPPDISEHNLKLVVSIFVAPECNSDTFHSTLETLSSLSWIPGTASVFSKELISHVKSLSHSISLDLDDLLPHLRDAQSSTDLHSISSSKFSHSGSDQVKLLRVLQALDYLSAPKKDAEDGEDNPAVKSILTSSYETLALGPLWAKLSDCLATIREKDNITSFANILLPLIESLMVVCKNTSLKDSVLARQVREHAVGSPPPESLNDLEELFFNFTTEHRKILNDIIRQSPKLMQGNGSFSLLVKNPKVLDFDNKRAYFTKQIHSRLHQQRHIQPPLQLSVRRDQVFLDSYKALYYKSADEMKYGKLNIRFSGEEGVDAGGVTREWFQVLARGMFNPDWALWQPVAADRTTFHPNPLSWINGEHLLYFKFIGRIIGKALHEGRVLDAHFSRAVYKRLLGKESNLKDLESMDLDYYKSLMWILQNDITDVITEDFSVIEEQFGEEKVVDLIPDGRNIPVTDENKMEYVNAQVRYRLTTSVKEQLESFVRGFHDIIPAELIAIFDEQELELLISGLPEIDVDDWRAHTEYHNYTANSPQVTWFWRIVRGMSNEEKAKLLQFVTGTSKVPLNGFKDLEGMTGTTLFSIHKDPSQSRLPTSHTCFNQLDLPAYDDYDTLRSSLMTAINLGADYFGFA